VRPEILIATFRLVETLLGDGSEVPGIVEFTARLAARREGYVLELSRVPSERSPDSGDDVRADDLGALRTWLRTLGVTWLESSQGERLVVELRIPRPVKAAVSETPAG
jgi:hypothetical protein